MSVSIGRISESVRGAVHVRADRSSVLGNPYKLNNESERDAVCDKYSLFFKLEMESNASFRRTLESLKRMHLRGNHVVLQCHCKPLRCHTETIKQWIES